MKHKHSAFTLVEVLISITLLSLVLMALYKSADILRQSNMHLFKYLEKASTTLKGSKILYKDLIYSDHNITIKTDDKFHRLTLNNTHNSLYGLSQSKVVWLVHKEHNTLLRIEGVKYDIPLRNEQKVEVDVIAKNVQLFRIYKSKKKDKILAIIQTVGSEPQLFMTQNLPLAPPKDRNKTQSPNNNPNLNSTP